MTKLTKNEKILRRASKKWEKFLAEGAFKKTVNEFDSDDAEHFDMKMDDDPSQYTAAANFKMGDVVKVMNRGKPKFDEPEELRCRVGTVTGMDGRDLTLKFDNGEVATITYFNAARDEHDLWKNKNLFGDCAVQVNEVDLSKQEDDEFQYNQAQAQKKTPMHMGKPIQVDDEGNRYIIDDEGRTVWLSVSDEYVEEKVNEARMGEYGKIDAEDGNPPTKIGRGNEEYMAAYNAVLQARGEEPLDIQKPDQAYLDALRSGQLEEQEDEKKEDEQEEEDDGFYKGDFGMELYDIDEKKNLKEEVTKRVTKLLSEGLTPEQVKEKIIEEGLGDFIRKGIDTVKKKTGLGKSMATRDSMENLRSLGFEFNEMLEEYLPTPEEIKVMSDVFADYGRSSAGGSSKDPLRQAFSKLPKVKQKVLMNPRMLRKQVKTFEKKADEIRDNIQRSGDKTAKKATRAALALLQQIEGMIPFATNLRKAFEEARKTGNAEGVKQLADQQAKEHRALMKQIDANTRASAAADRETGKQAKRDARRRDDKEQDIVRGKSTQRFGMATNLEEAVIEDFVFELEGGLSFADVEEAGLVTPGVDSVVDNGDGYAQVYAEPQAMAKMAKTLEAMTGVMVSPESHGAVDETPKMEDRTTTSSDPEFDQVQDIAADMLELSARSRIPVSLKSVQSALENQSFEAQMDKGMLIVDNKYVIADKKSLPATAQKISFTDYGIDYLSNLQGEQQDLPLG